MVVMWSARRWLTGVANVPTAINRVIIVPRASGPSLGYIVLRCSTSRIVDESRNDVAVAKSTLDTFIR